MRNRFDSALTSQKPALYAMLGGFLLNPPVLGQIITVTLHPETVHAFDAYVQSVEHELAERWTGKRAFLAIDDSAEEREKVLQGEVYVRPSVRDNPVSIPQGLIHDWTGTVFVPHVPIQKVLAVMQDFDRHSKIFPDIIRSRLVSRNGDEINGEWRLMRKSPFLKLVLDVPEQEFYKEVAPGERVCRAYAKNISEVENAGSAQEKRLPPGQGTGFLWRLYGYWSLEQAGDGVIVECRSVSLTRDVPAAVQWIARPFLKSVPRDSLAATLKDTRDAAEK